LRNELARKGRGKLIVSGKHHHLADLAQLTMISVHEFGVECQVEEIGLI